MFSPAEKFSAEPSFFLITLPLQKRYIDFIPTRYSHAPDLIFHKGQDGMLIHMSWEIGSVFATGPQRHQIVQRCLHLLDD
jgi:hypothetical protein